MLNVKYLLCTLLKGCAQPGKRLWFLHSNVGLESTEQYGLWLVHLCAHVCLPVCVFNLRKRSLGKWFSRVSCFSLPYEITADVFINDSTKALHPTDWCLLGKPNMKCRGWASPVAVCLQQQSSLIPRNYLYEEADDLIATPKTNRSFSMSSEIVLQTNRKPEFGFGLRCIMTFFWINLCSCDHLFWSQGTWQGPYRLSGGDMNLVVCSHQKPRCGANEYKVNAKIGNRRTGSNARVATYDLVRADFVWKWSPQGRNLCVS